MAYLLVYLYSEEDPIVMRTNESAADVYDTLLTDLNSDNNFVQIDDLILRIDSLHRVEWWETLPAGVNVFEEMKETPTRVNSKTVVPRARGGF